MSYTIFTDSGCDLSLDILAKWNVKSESLTFKFDGDDKQYRNEDMDLKVFYDRMRKGDVSKTSAVNMDTFYNAFDKELAAGNDLLYIGFSSGISTTSNSGIMAANELREKYPERKIFAFDTKCASAGQGLLVWKAVEKRDAGATIEEVAALIKEASPTIACWFTVSDLVYLKRGGRVSPASCFAATVLDIKPVMHVDYDGKLSVMEKVRGRRRSMNRMIELYEESAIDKGGMFTVCHGDALEEATEVLDEITRRFGARGIISEMGPVIGSHAGPGVLVLSYPAKQK